MRLAIYALIVAGLSACAGLPSASLTCEFTSTKSILAAGLASEGKSFCANMQFYSVDGMLSFYDTPYRRASRYKSAILVDVDVPGLPDLVEGKTYNVSGILDIEYACFSPTAQCVPISHPIYLKAARVVEVN